MYEIYFKNYFNILILINVCGCTEKSVFKSNITTSSKHSVNANEFSTTQVTKEANDDTLSILDNGTFKKGKFYIHYNLKDFICLLKKENIKINEISAASNIIMSDAGNVRFYDTKWDYNFSNKLTSFFDIGMLDRLIQKQELKAIYVKTKYETYVFRQSLEEEGLIQPIQAYDSDIIPFMI